MPHFSDQASGLSRDCFTGADTGSVRCGSPVLAEVRAGGLALDFQRCREDAHRQWASLESSGVLVFPGEDALPLQDTYRTKEGALVLFEAGALPCPWVARSAEL